MKWIRYTDTALLMLLSLAAILVGVADFTGLLDKIQWIPRRSPDILVLVLFGTIGLHLGNSHLADMRFHDSFEGGSKGLIRGFGDHAELLLRGVRGVAVCTFHNAAEQELYLAKRLEEAHVEVCDLSWKEKLSLHTALPDRVRSHKTYESGIAKAAKRIPYREVFVFSDERRKEKLRRRIEEDSPGYSCRYYDSTSLIPRLQFVIIDREEVVFASSAYPTLCAIRQAELAQIFQAYYEAIWEAARPLKEGKTIYRDEIQRVLSDDLESTPKNED
jgi:hypothetical protein